MYKEFNMTLTVKVRAVLRDPEATEQSVRFLIEEDLRDKGWDADVEIMERRGYGSHSNRHANA